MYLPYKQSNKTITASDLEFHYDLNGGISKPVLALVNMASVNLTAWERVWTTLLKSYRILRFDILRFLWSLHVVDRI